jgi:hypothetical protein
MRLTVGQLRRLLTEAGSSGSNMHLVEAELARIKGANVSLDTALYYAKMLPDQAADDIRVGDRNVARKFIQAAAMALHVADLLSQDDKGPAGAP